MTAAVTSPGATEVLAEIRTLRKRLPDVTGVLLAAMTRCPRPGRR